MESLLEARAKWAKNRLRRCSGTTVDTRSVTSGGLVCPSHAGAVLIRPRPFRNLARSPFEVDSLAAMLSSGIEQKRQVDVVRREKPQLDSNHVSSIGRAEVRDVDESEIHGALREIDPAGLQPRLVLRGAVMGHSKIASVQVINAGHHRRPVGDEILNDGGAVTGRVVRRIHRSNASARTTPFERAFPIAGERSQFVERRRVALPSYRRLSVS